ncbi:MAG: ABC transporter ATP-binding protein [Candidatus Izemoplasma sp.]
MSYFEEEDYTESKFDKSVWIKIFKYMIPFKKNIIYGVIGVSLLALVDILYPLINAYALAEIIETDSLDNLPYFIAMYVGMIVIQAFLVYLFILNAGTIQRQLSYELRKSAFRKLQELPFSYYDKTPVGWIMARMTSDSRNLSDILSWGLIDMTWGLLMMIGITIVMFIINVKLALIALAVVPALVVVSIYFRKKILIAYRKIRKENSKITGAYNEGITGAKTTKTLVLEQENFNDFDTLTTTMRDQSIRAAMFAGLYFPTILFISAIAIGLVSYYGGLEFYKGTIEVWVLFVFINYVWQFFEPIMQLASILARFQQAQASAERILSLIEQVPDITDSDEIVAKYGDAIDFKKENWEELIGEIEYKDITFKYAKGEKVLENFNLKIKAGESIALVGKTGAGKSTIVNLVCRFYEPTSGQILIDGKDYKERSLGWLHDNLGYVLQSPHLFSGTILENIRYGNHDATDEEVYEVAKLLEVDNFVKDFDKGYLTEVGEGGSRLSVGQKQLISFARALLADPRILILDEATSSVDTKTEKSIQRAIQKVLKGRTSIVIAHRLSTITASDKILVLEQGKIIEEGTHDELINLKKHYYKLYTNQFKNEVIEGSKNE